MLISLSSYFFNLYHKGDSTVSKIKIRYEFLTTIWILVRKFQLNDLISIQGTYHITLFQKACRKTFLNISLGAEYKINFLKCCVSYYLLVLST